MAATIENPAAPVRQHAVFPDGSTIVRAKQLPWTPWAMPGTYFKLLHIDDTKALSIILLKVDPGTVADVHRHIGDACAYLLDGGFGYEHGEVFEGDFICESGGITHTPITREDGALMLGFMFEGLGGVDAEGNLAGVLDNDWHYNTAKANGAADHIVRKQ
jgi:2,4'-dihydroxyacetophenone dioxygenase